MPLCRSCKKEILWLAHVETGKAMPVEAEKVIDGNIVIDERNGKYRIVTGPEWTKAHLNGIKLHISHFARCADAGSFRKTK